MPKGYPNPKPEEFTKPPASERVEIVAVAGGGAGPAPVNWYDAEMASQLAELKREREELAILKAKLERKAEIREEVSEAVMEQRRRDFGKRAEPVEEKMPPKPEGVELFAVKLEKNYRPLGYYETVGWLKPAVYRKKFGHDKPVMIEPEEFIQGEKAPPAIAGTGFANKIWAGTTIKVAKPEAERLVKIGTASRGFD